MMEDLWLNNMATTSNGVFFITVDMTAIYLPVVPFLACGYLQQPVAVEREFVQS